MQFKLIAIGVVLAAAAFFGWHYKSTLEENKRLEAQLLRAGTIVDAQDDYIQEHNAILDREREHIDEINNAPPEDDGPVAPVLMRTINRMSDNTDQ
jgi:predicted negative regulator of RcsB-dependent stress response